jgi:molybdate transport system substrate-binding protein
MPAYPVWTSRGFIARAAIIASALLLSAGAAWSQPAPSPAARRDAAEALFPPWQGEANNDAAKQGVRFTVPTIDVLADFHGSIDHPALVLFVGGNYFFAMAPLVAEFGRIHPEYAGKVFYETLPPGILEAQMRAGGTITCGNMTLTVKPDVYLAGLGKVRELLKAGLLTGAAVPYVTNNLTIMVPAANPAHIAGLADLGRPDLALVMPHPQFEGVARQIRSSLVKAGGETLATVVYDTKVKDGTTILTRIHHRQTPLFLMEGLGQAGVTWTSEAIFQEQVGHKIAHVAIPAAENTTAIYAAALAKPAAHPKAATAWLAFIGSDAAVEIFQRYGFKRYAGPSGG